MLGLDLRQQHRRLDVAPRPALVVDDGDADAVAHRRRVAQIPGLGEGEEGRLDISGIAEIAVGDATADLQVDNAFLKPVARDQLGLDLDDRLRREGHRDFEFAKRAFKPRQMEIIVDQAPVDDGGHFIDAVAKQQTPVEDRDCRLVLADEPAFHIDFACHDYSRFGEVAGR